MAKWHQLDAFDRLIACCCEDNQHSPRSMVVIQDLLNAYAEVAEVLKAAHEWFVLGHNYAPSDPQEGEYYEPCEPPGHDCEECHGMLHLTDDALKNLATVMGDSLT